MERALNEPDRREKRQQAHSQEERLSELAQPMVGKDEEGQRRDDRREAEDDEHGGQDVPGPAALVLVSLGCAVTLTEPSRAPFPYL